MKKLFLLFVYSCICLFIYLLVPQKAVRASGDFLADYDVQYDVAPSGVTIVTENIILTNKITNLYPQKYSILIDSENIRNVIAYDSGGMINPQITQLNNKTQIYLPFNDKVIGKGKQLKFSLRYENTDFAHKNGSIWEVNIPRISDDPDLVSYSVSLHVSPIFGENAYITPLPANGDKWTKEQMVQGGINAAYGTSQSFHLNLSYYIENTNLVPLTTEIALPPNTAYQTVIIKSITPQPKTVIRDDDGNWLAEYYLLPTQHMNVTADITVLVNYTPSAGSTESIPDRNSYLLPTKYWEVNDPQIQQLAKLYTTPRDIYNYVIHALTYDDARVSQSPIRKGAIKALASPRSSICTEFTDLFVAIARAAGIPAREDVGFAYTTNAKLRPLSLVSDVLHSWPEYYDTKRNVWIQIDPTWANTTGGVNYFDKLDFNHIVFAIHGKSSDYPNPAGFYKQNGKNTKDVDVSFTDIPSTQIEGKTTTEYQFPQTVTSGFPAKGNIIINNVSHIDIPQLSVSVYTEPFDISFSYTYRDVPPFAILVIPVSIPLQGVFLQGSGLIRTTVNNTTTQFTFSIQPFVYNLVVPLVIVITSLTIFIIIILKSKGIWKLHRKQ